MKIKTSYAAESEIPEGFAELYTETDGKWMLTGVDGMKSQADIDAIREGLTKERMEHKETKAILKKFGDHKPDEVDAIVQEVEELRIKVEAGGKLNDEQVAQLVDAKVRPVQKDLDKAIGERDEAISRATASDTRLVQSSRRDVVFAAIGAKEGIRKDTNGPILKFAEDELVFDSDTNEFATEAGLSVGEWLDGFCDKNTYVMEPSQGGGTGGGSDRDKAGDNCFTKKNVTEQMRLKRSDPVRYERLKKAYDESK